MLRSIIRGVLLVIMASTLFFSSVQAQEPEGPVQPRLLVAGVALSGDGYPVALVDMESETARTLATFASPPVCRPTLFPMGRVLIYELIDPVQELFTVYRVNIDSGERVALKFPAENSLRCPVISPAGDRIVWLQNIPEESQTALVVTDVNGENPLTITIQPQIYDVLWSPGGQVLVYHRIEPEQPFPILYSMTPDGGIEARRFWKPEQGLIIEYEWIPGGEGMLVAYQTESYTALTRLSLDCVIGPGEICQVEPLVTFAPETSIDLLNTYSPLGDVVIIILRGSGDTTELYAIDLVNLAPPRQLTDSPDLLKTEAHWHQGTIYFIGSRFYEETGRLRGAIYAVPVDGSTAAELRFESTVFSPATILQIYE